MSDRSKKLLTPLSKSEQGLLKGGSSVFSANSNELDKVVVGVSVNGNCSCKYIAETENELIISMFLSEHTKNEDSHA